MPREGEAQHHRPQHVGTRVFVTWPPAPPARLPVSMATPPRSGPWQRRVEGARVTPPSAVDQPGLGGPERKLEAQPQEHRHDRPGPERPFDAPQPRDRGGGCEISRSRADTKPAGPHVGHHARSAPRTDLAGREEGVRGERLGVLKPASSRNRVLMPQMKDAGEGRGGEGDVLLRMVHGDGLSGSVLPVHQLLDHREPPPQLRRRGRQLVGVMVAGPLRPPRHGRRARPGLRRRGTRAGG